MFVYLSFKITSLKLNKQRGTKMTKTLTKHAAAAKMIRAELKAAFPNIKFKVQSESYSMGNSVNVYWTDGVPAAEVNTIIKKYQEGHFDGMTDSYEFSNIRKDLPQAKFVFAHRTIGRSA